MAKETKLVYCEDLDSLAETVSKYVHDNQGINDNDERTTIFYPIVFRVDDAPNKEDWDKLSDAEKDAAFDAATGVYGIDDIGTQFDAESTKLACCFYGGKTIAVTNQIDEDSSEGEVYSEVYDMLDEATFCDGRRNILMKITVEVEKA